MPVARRLPTDPRRGLQFVLSTKVGRYGQEAFDFSAARVTQSVEESLQRLCVEHIDIIQCHDIEFVPVRQIIEETLPGAPSASGAPLTSPLTFVRCYE